MNSTFTKSPTEDDNIQKKNNCSEFETYLLLRKPCNLDSSYITPPKSSNKKTKIGLPNRAYSIPIKNETYLKCLASPYVSNAYKLEMYNSLHDTTPKTVTRVTNNASRIKNTRSEFLTPINKKKILANFPQFKSIKEIDQHLKKPIFERKNLECDSSNLPENYDKSINESKSVSFNLNKNKLHSYDDAQNNHVSDLSSIERSNMRTTRHEETNQHGFKTIIYGHSSHDVTNCYESNA
ncbi:hypothetical protein A3Q56_03143 [Intoshia linei]|uniref:Uncharacterized protein n=1 Tax=Intoshia linei TaxID=1819745 RepID=A0A177B4B0_9BILA|nr:hypothetical protein A3Q56_03143 [Intoshia linei]